MIKINHLGIYADIYNLLETLCLICLGDNHKVGCIVLKRLTSSKIITQKRYSYRGDFKRIFRSLRVN